jgi:hypothetical protein
VKTHLDALPDGLKHALDATSIIALLGSLISVLPARLRAHHRLDRDPHLRDAHGSGAPSPKGTLVTIIELQGLIGARPDGVWGEKSKAALLAALPTRRARHHRRRHRRDASRLGCSSPARRGARGGIGRARL